MRKRISSLVGVAALTAGIVAGLPSAAAAAPAPAAAWPEDCWYELRGISAAAECESGSGQYKAVVLCDPWSGGPMITRHAPVWRNAGSGVTSYVYCPAQTDGYSAGILTRA
ncbi:hypothetical protein ACFO4E_11300 [Nocardiopsis mangrovi]|uniref:Secreted protein n=1 Tax=Nocardiopsis mangrovi TaxID=1179818 RepID=A0ABV9DU73_9ACTN